ncbi:MAG: TonB-dependent receptor [Rhodospirillaceae bacterium]|nr:TonB-dependent receptor [Rhodospirillaceae bacterium]
MRCLFLARRIAHSMAAVAAVFTIGSMAAMPALAEDASSATASADSALIEEVVVMARRREENVQDVPLAITALTSDALEIRGIDDMMELEGAVPNLTFRAGRVSELVFSPALRGRRVGSDFLSLDQAVSLYSDGVNLPRAMAVSAIMVDLDRVEVLRGPQGTLYGRNSTGGAISVYANDPTDELSGSVRVEYGNYQFLSTEGIFNIPMGDRAGLRVVAQIRERDGFGRNLDGHDLADIDQSEFYRAVFRAELSDRFSVRAMVASFDSEGAGPIHRMVAFNPESGAAVQGACELVQRPFCDIPADFATVPGLFPALGQAAGMLFEAAGNPDPYRPSTTLGDTEPYSNGDSLQFSLQLDYDISDSLLLRSITGYNELSRDAFADVDGSPFSLIHVAWDSESEFFSQELKLLGSNENLDWVFGVYYGKEEGKEQNPTFVVSQLNPLSPFNFRTDGIENETQAAFAQADWRFSDGWTLTGGYRYTVDKRSTDASTALAFFELCAIPSPTAPGGLWLPFDPSTAQCPRTFKDKFKDDSWIVSLQRRLSDNAMVYGKVSKGYRTGGFNLRVAFDVQSGQAVDPETVIEYELGAKANFADGRVRLNGAVFFDDYDDMHVVSVVDTIIGLPATITENAASAEIFGVEGEARLLLADSFEVDLNFGYLDAENKERIREDGVDLSGTPMSGIPDWTFGVGAQYGNSLPFGDVLVRIGYQVRDKIDYEGSTPANDLVPGIGVRGSVGLLNAKVSVDFQAWNATLSLWGRNLTDEAYENDVIVTYDSLGGVSEIVGPPRTYGVSLTKRFGNF